MVRVLVKEKQSTIHVSLVRNCNPYSIEYHNDIIHLNSGWNELDELPYGFYMHDLSYASYIKEIDLSGYDTSKIVDMAYMFNGCEKLVRLDLSNFNSSNTIYLTSMFAMCFNLLSLDLSSFDTRNVLDMKYLFYNCSSLVGLNLSNFNTINVKCMNDMFCSCSSLKYIKCKRLFKEWCLKNKDIIKLPSSMCEGGDGIWDIID